jgi:hypothetical protein
LSGLVAALILIAVIVYLPYYLNIENTTTTIDATGNHWLVSNLVGSPKIQDKEIIKIDSIKIGEWLITDDSSKALLLVANIGEIIVNPSTKLKILKSDSSEHRIMLDYGTINANINAEPRSFVVNTKSVEAIDLGCAYTLSVDHKGNGLLYVKSGMVELESKEGGSLVSAGNFCITKEGLGPGTPYSKDSSPEFRKALLDFDFNNLNDKSLQSILKNAKSSDVMTLLQVLPKVKDKNRATVFTKITTFVPPPRKIYTDSIPQLDMEDLNKWIEMLNEEINVDLKEDLKNLNEEIYKMVQEKIIIKLDNEIFKKEFQEELQKEMEEVQKELEEVQIEIEINNEELQEELKRVQEELQKTNIEIELDKELLKMELEKAMEDINNMDIDIEIDKDELNRELEKAMEDIDNMDIDIEIDKDELNRELKKAREEIEKANNELEKFSREELDKEMENVRKELKKANEVIEKELEKIQEELKEEMKKEEHERIKKIEEGEDLEK